MRALLVVLSLLVAGCAASPESSEPTSDVPTPKDVEVTDTLGAISGVVVDQTITPLAGISVELMNQDQNITTDADGAFAFQDLEAGTYFLKVSGYGYASSQSSVDVVAGAVAKPRIMLEAVLVSEPVWYTLKFDGYMELYPTVLGGVINILWNDVTGENDPLCKCEFRFTEEAPDIKTFVIEAVWRTNIGNPAGDDTYQLQFSNTDGDGEIMGSIQESPLYATYGRELWTEDTTSWRSLIAGNGLFINVQEKYEEFITVFRVEPAPDGWSIVEQTS